MIINKYKATARVTNKEVVGQMMKWPDGDVVIYPEGSVSMVPVIPDSVRAWAGVDASGLDLFEGDDALYHTEVLTVTYDDVDHAFFLLGKVLKMRMGFALSNVYKKKD